MAGADSTAAAVSWLWGRTDNNGDGYAPCIRQITCPTCHPSVPTISPCGDDQVETGKQQKMFDMLLHYKIMKRKEQTPNADCFLSENI